jgi:hypothetical protein
MQNPQGQGNIFHFVSVIIAVSLQIFFARVAKKFSWKKSQAQSAGWQQDSGAFFANCFAETES